MGAIVQRLAATVDCWWKNFQPGGLQKFGLDADTLLDRDPRLVYCSNQRWGMANSVVAASGVCRHVQAEVGRSELVARLRGGR